MQDVGWQAAFSPDFAHSLSDMMQTKRFVFKSESNAAFFSSLFNLSEKTPHASCAACKNDPTQQ